MRFQLAVTLSAASEKPTAEATALSNLANVRIDLGHPDMAARLNNRGIAVLRTGTADRTLAAEELRLRLAQEARPSTPRRASAIAYDLRAGVYAYSRKPREAEQMERKAIAVFETVDESVTTKLHRVFRHAPGQ